MRFVGLVLTDKSVKTSPCSEDISIFTTGRFQMNDQIYAANVKKILMDCIADLDSVKWLFLEQPESDFTRDRKIPFETFIHICLQMEGGALQIELLKHFNFAEKTPTKSAFCQQRAKVSPEALKFLYCIFTEALMGLDAPKTFCGYRLIACDGSDINIPYNPADEETFHQNGNKKGYNQLHLNAFFDILNGIYIDCVLEPDSKQHERAAFNVMVDRYPSAKYPAIIMADRGYEGYNVFAHLLRSGQKFIIRMKDIDSNGILSAYDLPDGEFDMDIETILTRRQTNQIRQNRNTYTIIPSASEFDFLDAENQFFPMAFRILRIEVSPGIYECVATNLDREEFPPEIIKKLYHMRWAEEGSFRDLKFTIDLVHFHCKKRQYVEQEIWARLVLYNFCEAITRHITVTRQTGKENAKKFDYKINFATAACICRAFLKRSDGEINPCRLIGRFLIPIRPDRIAPRNIKPQSAKSFLYRAA